MEEWQVELESLRNQIQAMELKIPQPGEPVNLTPLSDQLNNLEAKLASLEATPAPQVDLSPLEAQLEAMREELAELKAAKAALPPSPVPVPPSGGEDPQSLTQTAIPSIAPSQPQKRNWI